MSDTKGEATVHEAILEPEPAEQPVVEQPDDVFTVGEKLAEEISAAAPAIGEIAPKVAARAEEVAEKIASGAVRARRAAHGASRIGRAIVGAVEDVRERGGAPLDKLIDKLWKTDPLPGFPNQR